MNHGARQVTWIPVSSVEGSANNETIAGMIVKQSAIFIDDGDVHRLIRALRNVDETGEPNYFCSTKSTYPFTNLCILLVLLASCYV